MATVMCSAKVPVRVEHERIWTTAFLETMRIGHETILFVKVMAPVKGGGEITVATLTLDKVTLLELVRKLLTT